MEKNQNNDKRNQDHTDNQSNQKSTSDFRKQETDPNNPVASKNSQNDCESNKGKHKDSTSNLPHSVNIEKSKSDYKDNDAHVKKNHVEPVEESSGTVMAHNKSSNNSNHQPENTSGSRK
jgi:hypothetical protein